MFDILHAFLRIGDLRLVTVKSWLGTESPERVLNPWLAERKLATFLKSRKTGTWKIWQKKAQVKTLMGCEKELAVLEAEQWAQRQASMVVVPESELQEEAGPKKRATSVAKRGPKKKRTKKPTRSTNSKASRASQRRKSVVKRSVKSKVSRPTHVGVQQRTKAIMKIVEGAASQQKTAADWPGWVKEEGKEPISVWEKLYEIVAVIENGFPKEVEGREAFRQKIDAVFGHLERYLGAEFRLYLHLLRDHAEELEDEHERPAGEHQNQMDEGENKYRNHDLRWHASWNPKYNPVFQILTRSILKKTWC
jgi:hypothetical protein